MLDNKEVALGSKEPFNALPPPPKSSNPGVSFDMKLWLAYFTSIFLKPALWLSEKARRDLDWLTSSCRQRATGGFTLAELLISLAILGVIATFTIPKILSSTANGQQSAAAKEVAAMVSGAYQKAQADGIVTSNTRPADLTPYMNYVIAYTSGNYVDPTPADGTYPCSATRPCLRLYQDGTLQAFSEYFSGTNTTNVIQFRYDPDGIYTGLNTNNRGASVQFELYYNGFITTRDQAKPNSCHSATCGFGPATGYDPSWFSW